MGNISSMMTKHIVVQRRLHRFAYLIIRIILCYQLWFTHAIPSLYFSSMLSAPELNTGNSAMAETTSEAYDHDGVSNHQPHGCLLNRLFRRRSKKTPKLRVTGLCAGKSPGPVNSPHKGPVTRKMFPFDDVIMRDAPLRQLTPKVISTLRGESGVRTNFNRQT